MPVHSFQPGLQAHPAGYWGAQRPDRVPRQRHKSGAGFPPAILRKEERRSYYSALEKADSNDYKALAALVGKDIEKTLDEYLEAAE